MANYRNRFFLMFLATALVISSCKKPWDDRITPTDQQLDINLIEQIQANSDLSTFAGYLTKIGYDKLLASSKNFTVWAPTNAALQTMDPAVVADTARLHKFVDNHIANQIYLTSTPKPSLRVRNLLGKNVTITATSVEEASITAANRYVSNGVLQVIDKMLPPKQTIDAFIRGLTTVGQLQKAYIIGQDTSFVDTSKATVASFNPTTGKPILVPGTGIVKVNKYYAKTRDLANEDSIFTYFVLADAAYNAERNKVSKYFTTVSGSVDTTMNMLAAFNVLKDMTVKGAMLPATIPSSLPSINGVPIPVNKNAIVQTYYASNGIVHVMSSVDFNVADKITPIIVQGEAPSFYSRTDLGNKIAFRARIDPTTGIRFTDISIAGADVPAQTFAAYKLSNLYTCQYNVVWRALNDYGFTTPTNILPRLTFGQITAVTINATGTRVPVTVVNFPNTAIVPNTYTETVLANPVLQTGTTNPTINVASGRLNVVKWSSVNMYFQGANSTTANVGAVTFDYVKLIPILQ